MAKEISLKIEVASEKDVEKFRQNLMVRIGNMELARYLKIKEFNVKDIEKHDVKIVEKSE